MDKMAENNKEVWFPTRLWMSGKKFDYVKFLLLFVKPRVAELKELKLIKRWHFLFYGEHINFMVRVDEKLENREEIIEKIPKWDKGIFPLYFHILYAHINYFALPSPPLNSV